MDVVYLFKENHINDSAELRYSLRSLCHLPHNNVWIVGEKPAWAINVQHIPMAQTKTKGQNVAMNMWAAVHHPGISDDFVLMNDDFFIMKNIVTIPNLNFGDMKQLIAKYDERYPEGSDYISRMKALYHMLLEGGYDRPTSYELHVPMILNKQRAIDMYAAFAGQTIYQFRTLYGNYFNIGGTPTYDVKVFNNPTHNKPAYNDNPAQYLGQQNFLSTTGGSFDHGFPGTFIQGMLKEKSIYER